ncbi:BatA domain-containing protein [Aurantibacillus circumpalustris]|uniref:BatA domain-containing protein n=1 Tax=Aurantibacillus circumpalustris TaxID=3036359 RepID=UPI00295C271B|nr:BatA domain-containing protein [Aurantibacillus circumpalustris]
MTFVSPLFLWALAAIAIPIIIHLFNFRKYTKVYFTNVKFLKELQQESKSKSRLKQILVLIARCFAIICLVLAFSQPIIQNENSPAKNNGINAISIYIDNSFSMVNVNKQGPLLEMAKSQAKNVLKVYSNADKFQIITNDFEGKHQRFNTKENALNIIDEIKVSSSVRNLSDVVRRQADFLNNSSFANKKIYVFSDAQRSTFNLEKIGPDTSIQTALIPLTANKVNNVFVDTCWFETPIQQKGFIQIMHAKITNNGDNKIDVSSAKLFINKQQIAIASFSLDPFSDAEIKFTFECKEGGLNYGSIKIEDYPVTFDNELFFAFNSKVNVSVSLINGKNQSGTNSFSSLFKNDSLFKFNSFSEQTIDYTSFKTSDVIILNELSELSSGIVSELVKFTNKGGALVIIPSLKINYDSYNLALAALKLPAFISLDSAALKTDKIEIASGFYSGVFEKIEDRMNLPIVNKHYTFVKTSRSDFEPLVTLQNGDVFIGRARLNNALVYLFSGALNDGATNFNKHALFVPSFYQISFSSLQSVPLFYQSGTNVVMSLKNTSRLREEPPHIIKTDSTIDIIPEIRSVNNSVFIYTQGHVNTPGFYEVSHIGTALLPVAFNYSRKESNLNCYSKEELTKTIEEKGWKSVTIFNETSGDISKQIELGVEGKKLWKLFIILALLFIATEIALLRLLK